MNKREFLSAACLLALPILPALPALAATTPRAGTPPASAGDGAAAWRSRIGEQFELHDSGRSERMTLTGVVARPPARGLDQFTLLFDSKGALPRDEGTRTLRDGRGRQLDLFLEPATGVAGRYIANFSLLA